MQTLFFVGLIFVLGAFMKWVSYKFQMLITAPIYTLKLDAGDFVHNQGRF